MERLTDNQIKYVGVILIVIVFVILLILTIILPEVIKSGNIGDQYSTNPVTLITGTNVDSSFSVTNVSTNYVKQPDDTTLRVISVNIYQY